MLGTYSSREPNERDHLSPFSDAFSRPHSDFDDIQRLERRTSHIQVVELAGTAQTPSNEPDGVESSLEPTSARDVGWHEAGLAPTHNDPSDGGPPGLAALCCEVCGMRTSSFCNGCHLLGYCGAEHQMEDWPRHAEECRPRSRNGSARITNARDLNLNVAVRADVFTPGFIFQVDAILLPADKLYPELVKATFEVAINLKSGRMFHRESCFTKFLGACASWIPDAQWDEDMHQIPTACPPTDDYRTRPRFSLHCRPNGRVNACYATLVNPEALRPSALSSTSIWGAIESTSAHCHGNGNFLILRHPPGICCPEVRGSFVEDATLDDVVKVIPYLEQRRHFMESTGGVKNKIGCPHHRICFDP